MQTRFSAVLAVVCTQLLCSGGFCLLLCSGWVSAQTVHDLDSVAASRLHGNVAADRLGRAVAVIGDINGDGRADLLVGAQASGAAARAYVVFGRADGQPAELDPTQLNGSNGFVMEAGFSPSGLGYAVSGLGDINGDGRADFAVGAPYAANTANGWYAAGAVFVVFGRAASDPFPAVLQLAALDGSDGLVIQAPGPNWNLGTALADAGDFDGDGHDDLLLGAAGQGVADRAFLLRGGSQLIGASVSLVNLAADNRGFELKSVVNVNLGRAMAAVGDLDGDGRSEVLLGAPNWPSVGNNGRVYLVHGRTLGAGAANVLDLDSAATLGVTRLDGDNAGNMAGMALAGAGDVNGDGVADFLIGAPGRNQYTGAAYLVFGGNIVSQTLDTLVTAGGATRLVDGSASFANNMVGAAVAGGRDLDGDGIGDMAIGMPGGSASNGRVGAIFVLPGHAGAAPAWPGDVDLSAAGVGERWNGVAASAVADTSQMLDWPALSMGGDVNGDGKPDLAIGSVRAEATDPVNGPWQGRVWLPIGPPFLDRIFRDGFELPTPP